MAMKRQRVLYWLIALRAQWAAFGWMVKGLFITRILRGWMGWATPPPVVTEPLIPTETRIPKERGMQYLRKSKRSIDRVFVHSSATKASRKVTVKDLLQWHVMERGWSDIGYHGFIKRNGTFEALRDIDRDGAHASGNNRNSIGIMMVGGLGNDLRPAANFTRAQFRTLRKVLTEQLDHYPDAEILGHRDARPTACPSFDVKHWWKTDEVRG